MTTPFELNETVEKLSRELKHLQCRLEHKFDIEKYKDSPKDIAVYIGFHDYETLLLCYSLLEDTAKSINYGSYTKLLNDNKLCRPRKLSCFNEFAEPDLTIFGSAGMFICCGTACK